MIHNISDYLTKWALSKPHNIYCEEVNGIKLSFLQLENKVNQCCHYFQFLEISKGQVLSIAIPNCISFIVLYLAAIRSGIIINPCQNTLSNYEIEKNLRFVKSNLLFTQSNFKTNDDEIKTRVELFVNDDVFFELLDKYDDRYFNSYTDEDDIICYYNSSGTSGNSKYIKYSHKNMLYMIDSVVKTFGFDSDSRHLGFLPFSFTSITNYSFLPTIFSGGYILLSDNFMSIRKRFWTIVNDYKINYLQIVPTIAITLISSKYEEEEINSNRTLDYVGCGSAPLSIETQKNFQNKFKIPIANLYGLCETGPSHFDDPRTDQWKPGGIGTPIFGYECKIVNKEFKEQPNGVIGEFALKGRNLFIGYLDNEKAEKEAFRSGFFLTGDLGFKDSNGKYYFNDRKKDLIIKAGVNIAPGEIEEIIYKIDGVSSVAVIGVPDKLFGEEIIAFVEKNDDLLTSEKIFLALKKSLQFLKIPKKIIFLEKLPQGPTGKILKRKLMDLYSNYE